MSLPDVVALAGVHPYYLKALATCFTVHKMDAAMDDAALNAVAPHIVGIASSGESKVPATLMARFPQLKIVSVFGVGYDGVDLAHARSRGIAVTHIGASVWPKNWVNTGPKTCSACFRRSGAIAAAPYNTLRKLEVS